jgi:hypothetical protein
VSYWLVEFQHGSVSSESVVVSCNRVYFFERQQRESSVGFRHRWSRLSIRLVLASLPEVLFMPTREPSPVGLRDHGFSEGSDGVKLIDEISRYWLCGRSEVEADLLKILAATENVKSRLGDFHCEQQGETAWITAWLEQA